MFKTLRDDINAVFERDPAVRSWIEVFFCYPGFHAVLFYRLARACWTRRFYFLGRLISHLGRFLTGVEIHPGARIGRRLFIDHGMGVVIGETAEIGDNVTLYHDVTLGGIAPAVDSETQVDQKRHPTLEDDVIVGSGAQILGPITVRRGARVGANSVVVRDVAAEVTVVGVPAKALAPKVPKPPPHFDAYGTPTGEVADPIARAVEGLFEQVQVLQSRVAELEAQLTDAAAPSASPRLGVDDGEESEASESKI